jgi:uncharacterized protein YigE (DUF2233 family)
MKKSFFITHLVLVFLIACNAQKNKSTDNVTINRQNDSVVNNQNKAKEIKNEDIVYTTSLKNETLYLYNIGKKKLSFIEHSKYQEEKNNKNLQFAINVYNNGLIVKNKKRWQAPSKDSGKKGVFSINLMGKSKIFSTPDFSKEDENTYKLAIEAGILLIDNKKIVSDLKKYKEKHFFGGIGIDNKGKIIFSIPKEKITYLSFAQNFLNKFNCVSAMVIQRDEIGYFDLASKRTKKSGNESTMFVVSKNKDNNIDETMEGFTETRLSKELSKIRFKGKNYILCKVNTKSYNVRLLNELDEYQVHDFSSINQYLKKIKEKHIFSFNAGMFDENKKPIGLFISQGKQSHEINLIKNKYGNFYSLPPNGVFLIDKKNKASIVTSTSYVKDYSLEKIKLATQSGPMMVINGKFNKAFNEGSKNLNIRNGVGVNKKGEVLFVISDDPVNFYEFSQLFRDQLECSNALYLDGVISQWFAPKFNERIDRRNKVGPILSISKK